MELCAGSVVFAVVVRERARAVRLGAPPRPEPRLREVLRRASIAPALSAFEGSARRVTFARFLSLWSGRSSIRPRPRGILTVLAALLLAVTTAATAAASDGLPAK